MNAPAAWFQTPSRGMHRIVPYPRASPEARDSLLKQFYDFTVTIIGKQGNVDLRGYFSVPVQTRALPPESQDPLRSVRGMFPLHTGEAKAHVLLPVPDCTIFVRHWT